MGWIERDYPDASTLVAGVAVLVYRMVSRGCE